MTLETLLDTLFDVLELYGTKREDETICSLVYRICIQLSSMGFHLQLLVAAYKHKWLLNTIFHSVYHQFIAKYENMEKSAEENDSLRFFADSFSASSCSSSAHSRRSSSVHTLCMSHQSTSSGLSADNLLIDQDQRKIWLYGSDSRKENGDYFYFRVDQNSYPFDPEVKRAMFHYEMSYYVCQCASCMKRLDLDEVESLVHFIEFATCILAPLDKEYTSCDLGLGFLSLRCRYCQFRGDQEDKGRRGGHDPFAQFLAAQEALCEVLLAAAVAGSKG